MYKESEKNGIIHENILIRTKERGLLSILGGYHG